MLKNILKKSFLYKKFYYPRQEKKEKEILQGKISAFCTGGLTLLKDFSALMDGNSIPYWLEFGSLLGAYRDKKFIVNDFDIDVGAYLSDAQRIYDVLTNNGFSLIREFHVRGENGLEQTYEYAGTTIDVFYFFNRDGFIYCNGFYDAIKQSLDKYFDICVCEFKFKKFNISKIDFLGLQVSVPEDTELHIIEVYGNTYKVYDPNFKDGYNKTKYSIQEKVGCGFFLR